MEEIEISMARKQNMKIYSLYRTIYLDIIFYYAIEFLFLTQVKNISSSDFVLSSSMFAIFMIILQIPASTIIIIGSISAITCCVADSTSSSKYVAQLLSISSRLPLSSPIPTM